MSITLLIVGAVVAITATYAVTAQGAEPAVDAGQTAVGLGSAASDTVVSTGEQLLPGTATEWQITTVDSLSAAEDLLDCLEAQGHTEREMVVLGNSCFAVRWK
jgi:hypothetical protein